MLPEATLSLLALVVLFVSSLLAIPWTPRRYLFYCFAFVAFSTYFVLGPPAALLALVGAALGGAAMRARAAFSPHGFTDDDQDRLRSLFAAAGAAALAMLATHAARLALGLRVYPLPMGTPRDVVTFVASLVFLFVVYTVAKGPLGKIAYGAASAPPPPQGIEQSSPFYLVIAIVGFPLHVTAQAAYARDELLPWIGVLAWSVLMNVVISREVARVRRVEQLSRELATKERLAAIGEVTARVVHQTRHQLGLIGIIVRRIERRTSALPEADAEVVRGELGKLGEVQRELAEMLTRDLRGESTPQGEASPSEASYAALVTRVARRLEGLAAARGVKLDVTDVAAAEAVFPRDADNVGRAIFNVLENAVVAAAGRVWIEATREGAQLVLAVRDDGPGVPENVLRHATEPFVTTKPEGTGMGLAIALAAVREEGGTLRLVNQSPGLRVDFVLPVAASSERKRRAS